MALTLPYPSLVFVPLDILTADQMNEIVANYEYIANQFPITADNIAFATYSSSEQVVGTWTNGKTIYRKVVDSGAITGSTSIVYDAITGAEELISISGYWLNGSNNQRCSFNGTFVAGGPIVQATRAVLYDNDHTIKLNFTQISGIVPSSVRFVVAIEYTKA